MTKTLWRSEGQVVKLPKFAKCAQIMNYVASKGTAGGRIFLMKDRAVVEQALGLRALIIWGWIACDARQKEEGHKFLYNA